MGPGLWAHGSTGWSLTTSKESGSEEAVRARREPNPTKALAVSVLCEPSRLSPAWVAQACEEVGPRTPCITSRASPRGLVGHKNTAQPVGRRAAL
jgi:hypothetical protein